MACYTHYWRTATWDWHRSREGKALDHTAGNEFRKRGVGPDDFVYVVTIKKGKLFLLGRLKVRAVLNKGEAERQLGESLWDAAEHLVSDECTPMHFRCRVPDDVVRKLSFGDGRPLTFDSPGILNQQTLRTVRRMSPKSAELLDKLLKKPTSTRE